MVSHEQWCIIFGKVKISRHNIQIFCDISYNAVYTRISRVAGSMDKSDKLSFKSGRHLHDRIIAVSLLSYITAAAVRLV